MGVEKISRLGDCEVCGAASAKYTCPKCEVKTCCLDCVNIHKKELDCDGKRNKVKFLQMKKFSNLDLQSDYILLEETTRAVEKFAKHKLVKNPLRFQSFQPYYANYNPKQKRQRNAAWRRGIQLKFLPTHFTKRKNNSLYHDQKKDVIFFCIEWIFPQAENLVHFTRRNADSDKLATLANRFMDEASCPDELKEKLQFYQSAGLNGVSFLLKAENVPGEKFFELDHQETLRSNLTRKVVIEYPTIHVVLKDHKYAYETIEPDDYFESLQKKHGDDSSVTETNMEDENLTAEFQVKSEPSQEDFGDHETSDNPSSSRQADANSRYLFLCGEIDSDGDCDNEELEMENGCDNYQDSR